MSSQTEMQTDRDIIIKAQGMVGKLFRGNQKGWPDDMFIMVKTGDLKDILDVLCAESVEDTNALGARRKDV